MTDEHDRDDPYRDEHVMNDEQLTPNEETRLAAVADLLADPALWAQPSEGLEDAVLAAIRTERATSPSPVVAFRPPPLPSASPAPSPAVSATAASATAVSIDRAPSARRPRWVALVGAAVASAAAAVLITTAVVRRDQSDGTSAGRVPAATTVPTTDASADEAPDRLPDSAFPDSVPTQVLPNVPPLTTAEAPRTFALEGSDLAPDAAGTVDVSVEPSGTRLNIQLTGLDDRSGDDFYQVWLSDCAGTVLIPAGSFRNLTDVSASAAGSPQDYPLIIVTAESAAPGDGVGQESSGEVYVSGVIGFCPA